MLVSDHGTTNIYVLNASNGAINNSYHHPHAGDATVGTFPLDLVGVGDDGILYFGNLALEPERHFQSHTWNNVGNSAPFRISGLFAAIPGSGSGDRWGDTMAIRGAGANTQILLGSRTSGLWAPASRY